MTEYCQPEKGHAALLTISAQRDFTLPGSPIRASGLDRALPAMQRIVEDFRERGAPIFHSVRLYRADGSNADLCRRRVIEEGARVLMPGSCGAELLDEVQPQPHIRLDPDLLFAKEFQEIGDNEYVFYRPRWGAFHETGLEQRLRTLNVSTLVICGLSFSTGVRATIYEASARDFRLVLVPDALCNCTEDGIRELGRMGVYLMDSCNCMPWLAGPATAGADAHM